MSRSSRYRRFFEKLFRRDVGSTAGFASICFLLCLLILFSGKLFSLERKDPALERPPASALYRHSGALIDLRVEDLLSRMTLREKIGQMALVEKNSVKDLKDLQTYGIGALLSGAGATPEVNTLAGWREMIKSFREASLDSRLGIPVLYGVDAVHGHSNIPDATIFPHAIGIGATGDPILAEKVARATAEELAATGIYWSFSPTLDLPQDIRWGRVFEAFSDDPELAAKLGAAQVSGLQNNPPKGSEINIMSTAKHYIGAGGMVWGSSSGKDYRIDQGTTPQDEGMLRDVYLPPFIEAVNAGVESVMVGLNSWGDTKLSAEKYLVSDVLKGELGFTGMVVSDWYGVYEIPGGKYHALVSAVNAGVDLVMLPYEYEEFIRYMETAVEVGAIPEERIDDAVRRILHAKFKLGLFDEPRRNDPVGEIGNHRALAEEAVEKSLVLLKNDGVLPIKDGVHIRVGGSAADNVGRQSGGWTVAWQGVEGNVIPNATSILEGIRERASAGTLVEYAQDGNFATSSKLADVAIAVVGEKPYAEGWGDDEFPTLSPEDQRAIENLKASSRAVVVVIVSGRPLFITDDLASWDALVAAWLPGSEGQGVAHVLFGDKPFTGKLPISWPRTIEQLPIIPNDLTSDGTTVLFPHGYGMTN